MKEYENKIHELEKKAMTGDKQAVIELISLRRVLWGALTQIIDSRSDGWPDPSKTKECVSAVNQYLLDRFWSEGGP